MSERLEEIKRLWDENNDTCAPNDYEWLIKQAERVEELKKGNIELNREIGYYSEQVYKVAQSIGSDLVDLRVLSTRMLKGESE